MLPHRRIINIVSKHRAIFTVKYYGSIDVGVIRLKMVYIW